MKPSQHSPLPWAFSAIPGDHRLMQGTHNIAIVTGWPGIPHEEFAANKAFIVEACNNYERLQAENEKLRAALKYISEDPYTNAREVASAALSSGMI